VRVAEQALATASTPRIAVSFKICVFMLVSYRVADLGVICAAAQAKKGSTVPNNASAATPPAA